MIGRALGWVRIQPDRPFVILYAHLAVVILYATGNAVSAIPFSEPRTQRLLDSPLPPVTHALAALGLLVAIVSKRHRGVSAGLSVLVWGSTTAALFFLSYERVPHLALWAFALSSVITLAAFLMFVRWGIDEDDPRGT